MAIRIMPQAQMEPVRSQTGGADGRIEPVRDASAGSLLAVGEGATDLGRAITVAADRFQDQVDLAQSQRMRNLYDAETENEMIGPSGFLTTVGMDANDERRKQAGERLRQKRQKIEGLAQNEAQKLNFAEFANRSDSESAARARVHQFREVRSFRVGETKVAAERGIQRGVQLAGTEEGEIAVAMAMKDYDTLADLYGWPKDSAMREQLKQGATDTLHSGVIDVLLTANQPNMAHSYLEDKRATMSPGAAAEQRRLVDRSITDQVARTVSAQAYAQAETEVRENREPQDRDLPLDAAEQEYIRQRAYAIVDEDAKLSPEHKAETTQRLQFVDHRRRQVQAGQIDVAMTQAEEWLQENPLHGVSEMPEHLFIAAKNAGKLPQLGEFARNHRYSTDSRAFERLRGMTSGQLAAMTDVEFRAEFRGALNNHDYAYGEALHKKATGKTGGDSDRIISQAQQVEKAAADVGIVTLTGRRTEAQEQAFIAYRQEIQKRIDAKKATMKPDAPFGAKELQEVLDGAAIDKAKVQKDLVFDSLWSDAEKPVIAMTPAEQDAAYIQVGEETVKLKGQIPTEFERIAMQRLQSKGLPVTQKAIAEMWVAAGKPK